VQPGPPSSQSFIPAGIGPPPWRLTVSRWRLRHFFVSGFALLIGLVIALSTAPAQAGSRTIGEASIGAAEATWPPSSDLLVGEVVTGGASGSDEFLELYNAADLPVELGGLELVYVSASGATVTRKQSWTSRRLGPGEHLLLANEAGTYADLADHTYSGGLSATGGSLVLRVTGGGVIDSLSWGTASSAFVEGAPGPAPLAGQSLERLPGGAAGNGRDTNDNRADTFLQAMPIPEGRRAEPDPTPGPEPTPAPDPDPTPEPPAPDPEPTLQPDPTPADPTPAPDPDPSIDPPPAPGLDPTPVPQPTMVPDPNPSVSPGLPTIPPLPTPGPTATPTPTASPRPTATPTSTATPAPTATPRPTATPTPTATPSPAPTATPRPTLTPAPTPALPGPDPISTARRQPVGSLVTVVGTVTAEPGRIVGERVLALQDPTGGILVRLPAGVPLEPFSRGRIVQVSGALAEPYANLELRPSTPAQVVLVGTGGLPQPRPITSRDLGESSEGELLRLTGTVARIESASTGTLSITVTDDAGEARVFVHAPAGTVRQRVSQGARLRVTGIGGQRESRSGSGDGHRLWPRDDADVEVLADAAPTPRPTGKPGADATPTPRPRGDSPSVVRIRRARSGETVTIEGVVTSPSGLVDSDRRRVTVEDGSGAILVRFPVAAPLPPVGARVRVSGQVGTWYDAPQLAADAEAERRGSVRAVPTLLRRPPAPADEWRLVTVVARVTNVARDGEKWRAEVTLGAGGALPVVGVSGSGIPASALVEGRGARITGIVRRAWPTASDQRPAIMPRSSEDIELGAEAPGAAAGEGTGGEPGATDGGDDSLGVGGGDAPGGPAGAGAVSAADAPFSSAPVVDASLASLAVHRGRVVRAGGSLAAHAEDHLVIDDGTAQARVRTEGGLGVSTAALEVGDVVNVTGRVERDPEGAHEIVMRSVADLVRAADLGPGATAATAAPAAAAPHAAGLLAPDRPAERPGVAQAVLVALAGVLLLVLATLAAIGFAWLARTGRLGLAIRNRGRRSHGS
jgi:hypothetical protein